MAGLSRQIRRALLTSYVALEPPALSEIDKDAMRDALVSLVHSIGISNLRNSTLLKQLNAGNFGAVPEQFMVWTRALDKEVPGLRARREAEVELWNRSQSLKQAN